MSFTNETVYIILFALSIAIAVFSVAMILMDRNKDKGSKTEERLQALSKLHNRTSSPIVKSESNASEAITNALNKAAPQLSKPLTPKTLEETNKLKQRLSEAGFRNETAFGIFLSSKVILALFFLVIGGGLGIFLDGFSVGAGIKALLGGGAGFYLPEIVLNVMRSKRKKAIFLGLPDALDLMVVCVESGLGLDQALRKVVEEMKAAYRTIADEFGICNMQLQMGRPKSQVLQDLGSRNGVDELRALASLLIQADKFGSSVGQALRVQSDSMRVRRQQIAEEKAAKTAVKLIFPLVLFIFPGVFVVLVGPAALQMMRDMFPAMQGK
jgi:tight adherence protein C